MNLYMVGIDFVHAPIEKREPMSFSRGKVQELLHCFPTLVPEAGFVLLATCNRTELYIHTNGAAVDPLAVLCRAVGTEAEEYRPYSIIRQNEAAAEHLLSVAAGLESQIFGDDQIITQVRDASTLAREEAALDPVLDTLFRKAVTAGKRVKTQVQLTRIPSSAASRGVEKAMEFYGDLQGKHAMVIGNGAMGRLAAEELYRKGCTVVITQRTYRHGETIVPAGCTTHPYDDRYDILSQADVVVSATTSPHHTLTHEQVTQLNRIPPLFLDLAMPRDIESAIGQLPGVTVLNLDDLGEKSGAGVNDLAQAQAILKEQFDDFKNWYAYRQSLPLIAALKDTALERLRYDHAYEGLYDDGDVDGLAALAVQKTVDMLLGGLKDSISPAKLAECLAHMQKGAGKKAEKPRAAEMAAKPAEAKKQAVPAGTSPRFPMFLDLQGKKCVIVGAGKIAKRRVDTLKKFGADVVVIAPEARADLELTHARPYTKEDLIGAALAVAATNDRAVNYQVGQDAAELGIPVSVADNRDESRFYFPAVCLGSGFSAGVVSAGDDHHGTAAVAKQIRQVLEGFHGTN